MLQWILGQRSSPIHKRGEEDFILLQVSEDQVFRKVALAIEVIEETALGNAGFADDVLDGRPGITALQDDALGGCEDVFASLFAFGAPLLYLPSGFFMIRAWLPCSWRSKEVLTF